MRSQTLWNLGHRIAYAATKGIIITKIINELKPNKNRTNTSIILSTFNNKNKLILHKIKLKYQIPFPPNHPVPFRFHVKNYRSRYFFFRIRILKVRTVGLLPCDCFNSGQDGHIPTAPIIIFLCIMNALWAIYLKFDSTILRMNASGNMRTTVHGCDQVTVMRSNGNETSGDIFFVCVRK